MGLDALILFIPLSHASTPVISRHKAIKIPIPLFDLFAFPMSLAVFERLPSYRLPLRESRRRYEAYTLALMEGKKLPLIADSDQF